HLRSVSSRGSRSRNDFRNGRENWAWRGCAVHFLTCTSRGSHNRCRRYAHRRCLCSLLGRFLKLDVCCWRTCLLQCMRPPLALSVDQLSRQPKADIQETTRSQSRSCYSQYLQGGKSRL